MPGYSTDHSKRSEAGVHKYITEAQEAIDKLALLLSAVRKVLCHTKDLQYDTPRHIAASLRYHLSMRLRWLLIREAFIAAGAAVSHAMTEFDHGIYYPAMNQLQHRTASDIYDHKARDFGLSFPSPAIHQQVYAICQTWKKLTVDANDAWKQTQEVLKHSPPTYNEEQNLKCGLPPYSVVKKLLPPGGRDAYSAIMACEHGYTYDGVPSQDRLFGWGSSTYDSSRGRLAYNIQQVIRGIYKVRVNKGRPDCCPLEHKHAKPGTRLAAPSYKRGCELLNAKLPTDKPPDFEERFAPFRLKYREQIEAALLSGTFNQVTPSLLKLIITTHVHRFKVNNSVARRIMNTVECHNSVGTVLTGSVKRAGGDDYYAPIAYSNYGRMHTGYALFRLKWPDYYHHEHELPHLELSGNLDVAAINARLDEASRRYFRNLLDEKERALTSKQRIARLLWTLKKITIPVCREHSYAVSNCSPGTEAFIAQLQLDQGKGNEGRVYIDAWQLAHAWRKAKYPQYERFSSVVRHLQELMEQQQERAFAAIATIMEPLVYLDCQNPDCQTKHDFLLESNQPENADEHTWHVAAHDHGNPMELMVE